MTKEQLEQYRAAEVVYFVARRFNTVVYRHIMVGDVEVPLTHLFTALGVTPQQLSIIFADGLENDTSYRGLGSMHGCDAFSLLATLLQKKLNVVEVTGENETIGGYGVFPLSPMVAAEAAARWTQYVVEKREMLRRARQASVVARRPWWVRLLGFTRLVNAT